MTHSLLQVTRPSVLGLCGALAALLLAACPEGEPSGNDNQNDNGNGNTGCEAGDSRCQGTVVETCSGGLFVAGEDCADSSALCELDAQTGAAGCTTPGCTLDQTRCQGTRVERCDGTTFTVEVDCALSGALCRLDIGTGDATCLSLAWEQFPVEIVDATVNGSSLMVPVDGISFAYDGVTETFVTSFDRDYDDPSITYLWQVDAAGDHTRHRLSGSPFPEGEGFCVGGESWCQFIGRDPVSGQWVVLGPSTTSVMRVGGAWDASLQAVTGSHPGDSMITHTHRFDWTTRQLFLYGSTGPSSFGSTVFAFDLDDGVWDAVMTGLPQVDENCLAYDSQSGDLYSFGGRLTTDGGNTTETLGTFRRLTLATTTATPGDLPAGMGPRHAMSCAYDETRNLLYVFGGAVVNDYWNEIENEYHNDLWAYNPTGETWTLLIPDTESGTFLPPDSYGDRGFEGFPEGPNFGQNRGYLQVDPDHDRLLLIGAVPRFTHEQIYRLPLAGIEDLL